MAALVWFQLHLCIRRSALLLCRAPLACRCLLRRRRPDRQCAPCQRGCVHDDLCAVRHLARRHAARAAPGGGHAASRRTSPVQVGKGSTAWLAGWVVGGARSLVSLSKRSSKNIAHVLCGTAPAPHSHTHTHTPPACFPLHPTGTMPRVTWRRTGWRRRGGSSCWGTASMFAGMAPALSTSRR